MPPNRGKKKWYEIENLDIIIYPALCFVVLFLYTLIISCIPNFFVQIYHQPLMIDQPFSELVERKLPISATVLSGVFLGLCGLYLLYSPIDFFISTFYPLIFLVNVSAVSNITLNSSAALQNVLVVFSLIFTHHIAFYELYTWPWFIAVFGVWGSIIFACLLNLDCAGILVSIIVHLILSIFSQATEVSPKSRQKKRPSMFTYIFNFLKLFAIIFLPSIPFIYMAYYVDKNVASTPFVFDVSDFNELKDVILKNESVSLLIILIISTVSTYFTKPNYMMLIVFAGLVFGAVVTIGMPIQTNGDTLVRKIHFAKVQLILAIAVLNGASENQWHGRGLMALNLVIGYIARLIYQRNEAQAPAFQF